MNNLKILRLQLRNFKGFSQLDMPLSADSVILGGMNGFGKTTLFDAIELLFTGKIGRLDSYCRTLTNRKYSLSQNVVPLVNNMEDDTVSVSGLISIGEKKMFIKRQAMVTDMKNPINFSPFDTLYYLDAEMKDYVPLDAKSVKSLQLDKLKNDYNFLNYLSQEETLSFLKCKDADRAQSLQSLFNTERFDLPMEKIMKIIKALNDNMGSKQSKIKQLDKDISQLQQKRGSESTCINYIQLCKNDSEWDQEKPNLSYEDYNSFVSEGGVLDNLNYYIKYEKDFRQYNKNGIITHLLLPNTIDNIIFYIKSKNSIGIFNQYKKWRELRKLLLDSTVSTLGSIKLSDLDFFKGMVTAECISESKEKVGTFRNAAKASGDLRILVSDLISRRDSFVNVISSYKGSINISSCPVCGTAYKDASQLWNSIINYKDKFEGQFADINKGLTSHFENLKKYLIDALVSPIDNFFAEKGINDDMLTRFTLQDTVALEKDIKILEQLSVNIDTSKQEQELLNDIENQLKKMTATVPDDINYQLLTQTYNSYVRYLNTELFTDENIENKRQYLISQWNMRASEMLKDKLKMKDKLDKDIEIFNDKKTKITLLNKELKAQHAKYLNKVIDNIQILFYIYSGRILQESYFGRGLFLKPEIEKKRILFVSGKYNDNELDALYNMSSGQLVAVAISLMLSLNKLYSDTKLIAIDDPVQTIDDINLWGLMETLRHDFKDYFILLSTHEKNFGQLLDYKFRKMNMNSQYIDMAVFHSDNVQLNG